MLPSTLESRGDGELPFKELIHSTLNEVRTGVPGIPTGLKNLDEWTGGLQRSDLIILASRPSMGKTTLSLQISRNVAAQTGLEVVFFSLEMSKWQVARRLLAVEAKLSTTRFRSEEFSKKPISPGEWSSLQQAGAALEALPIHVVDNPRWELSALVAKAHDLCLAMATPPIGLVVVDYLQLVGMVDPISGDSSRNRQEELTEIVRSLKKLARTLSVPVLCTSQVSRAVESRSDHRPLLTDLRDSKAIEEAADLVLFLYRDEYYYPGNEESRGCAEVIIAKNRNGPVGTVAMRYENDPPSFAVTDQSAKKV